MCNRNFATLLIFICFVAGCNAEYKSNAEVSVRSKSSQSSDEPERHASRHADTGSNIKVGARLDAALLTLDAAGATQESVWQWRRSDEDVDVKWRDLSDGVTLAIHFKNSTQEIIALQMMYIPPNYDSRHNYRIVDVRSVQFHADGTYSAHFEKPKSE